MKRVYKNRVELAPLKIAHQPIGIHVTDETVGPAPRDIFTSRVRSMALPVPDWPPSVETLRGKYGWVLSQRPNLPKMEKFNVYTRRPELREKARLLPLSRNPFAEHTGMPMQDPQPPYTAPKVPAVRKVLPPPPACSVPACPSKLLERKAIRMTRKTAATARRRENLLAVQRRAMESMTNKLSKRNLATNENEIDTVAVRQKLKDDEKATRKQKIRSASLKLHFVLSSMCSLKHNVSRQTSDEDGPTMAMSRLHIPRTHTRASSVTTSMVTSEVTTNDNSDDEDDDDLDTSTETAASGSRKLSVTKQVLNRLDRRLSMMEDSQIDLPEQQKSEK